mgnify:FL=1
MAAPRAAAAMRGCCGRSPSLPSLAGALGCGRWVCRCTLGERSRRVGLPGSPSVISRVLGEVLRGCAVDETADCAAAGGADTGAVTGAEAGGAAAGVVGSSSSS